MAERTLKLVLVGDSRQLERTLGRAQTKLNKFSKFAGQSGLGGGVVGLGRGTAITAGVGAGVLGLKSVTDAATNAQVILGQTSVALTDAGLSWAKYGKQVQAASLSISKSSSFDDEAVLQSFAVFVRGQKDVAKSLQLSQLAADVARGRYTDLATATMLVNKASFGQIGALRRAGINIDKNATATEALTALQKAYGGAAVKYANTAAGAQDKARVSAENLRESIGGKLLPEVIVLADEADTLATSLGHAGDLADKLGAKKLGGGPGGGFFKQLALSGFGPPIEALNQINNLLDRTKSKADAAGASLQKMGQGSVFERIVALARTGFDVAESRGHAAVGAPRRGPLITQTSNQLRSQELDARLSGNKAALKGVLAREAQALRGALKDPRLRGSQRVALKQELLGINDEIAAMDDEMLEAAKDKKQAAADARKKVAAEAAAARKKLAAANKDLIAKFKDQADAIKSAVLDAFDTKTDKIQNARALADAKAALRVARQIGGKQGIKLATRDLTDAQRAIRRQQLEDTTFRVGRGPAGPVNQVSVGTAQFFITTNDPEKAAREVLKILSRKSSAGAPQSRGRVPGRQAY